MKTAKAARITSPLKWHGGKNYLASRLVAMMPPHTHYVEAFAGGLSVLLAKDPEGVSEVANDLDGDLARFWSVLRHPGLFPKFRQLCEATAFDRVAWQEAAEIVCNSSSLDQYRAWAFFVLCRQSLAGRKSSFAPLSKTRTRRGMNEQASAWMSAVEGLPEVHRRLIRVVVENKPALKIIKAEDSSSTFFYTDPPYIDYTRTAPDVYAHEMTVDDHVALLDALAGIKGKFMLSGYDNPHYSEAAKQHGWHRVDFDLPNNAAGGDSKRRMTECVWMNYR